MKNYPTLIPSNVTPKMCALSKGLARGNLIFYEMSAVVSRGELEIRFCVIRCNFMLFSRAFYCNREFIQGVRVEVFLRASNILVPRKNLESTPLFARESSRKKHELTPADRKSYFKFPAMDTAAEMAYGKKQDLRKLR